MIEIDKRHKKIDLRDLDIKKAKELGIKIGATAVTLFMLSGCGKKKAEEHVETTEYVPETSQEIIMEESNPAALETQEIVETTKEVKTYDIKEHDPSEIVENGEIFITEFDDGRIVEGNKYTYDDLAHAVSVDITINTIKDYDDLNYMPNLKNVIIRNFEDVKADNVDGSRLSSGISVRIFTTIFDKEKFGFLEDVEDIDTLYVYSHGINSDYLQSLRQVHNLELFVNSGINFKYEDLTYLDSLALCGEPYTIPVYFSNDILDELKDNGVKVDYLFPARSNDYDEKDIREINDKLDAIVESFNLSENATDQEKLNAVLTYVLCNFEYDPDVASAYDEYGLGSSELHAAMSKVIGENGDLEAGLERDTQICYQYAAMTSALLNRLDVDSDIISSRTHAWNIVKIGDYYYYVDSTWLDSDYSAECFKNNDTKTFGEFSWYLVDPTEIKELDPGHSHEVKMYPSGVELKDIPEDVESSVRYQILDEEKEIVDISDKKFEVTVGGKIVTVGAAAFIGILAALGVGKLVYDKKQIDEIHRRRRQEYDPYSEGGRRY